MDKDVRRDTPEDCIDSLNLLSRAIGSAHKDIIYYSSLQGEMLKALKKLFSPEGYRLISHKNIDMSKTHAKFLLRFYELVEKYPCLLFCELPQNCFVKSLNTIELVCVQTEIIGVICNKITCSNKFPLSHFFSDVSLEIFYMIFYPDQRGSMSSTFSIRHLAPPSLTIEFPVTLVKGLGYS